MATGAVVAELNAGDTIEPYMYQLSGVTSTIDTAGVSVTEIPQFDGDTITGRHCRTNRFNGSKWWPNRFSRSDRPKRLCGFSRKHRKYWSNWTIGFCGSRRS